MNLFLIGYVGAFIKWLLHGFQTKYHDEYNETKKSKRLIKNINIDTENSIIGYVTVLIIIVIFMVSFKFITR